MRKSVDELPNRLEQDRAEAVQLYRLAAEQEIAGAQCRLGAMYAQGRKMAQDDNESVQWFRVAVSRAMRKHKVGSDWRTARGGLSHRTSCPPRCG